MGFSGAAVVQLLGPGIAALGGVLLPEEAVSDWLMVASVRLIRGRDRVVVARSEDADACFRRTVHRWSASCR